MRRYLCEYRHSDGAVYGVEIMASSFEDARERMRNIGGYSGRVCGPIEAKIRVPNFLGRLIAALTGDKSQ